MKKEIVSTTAAPSAIGPYSQAVKTDGLMFTSGMIAIDPTTGQLSGEGIEDQTKLVMENLKALIESTGSSLDSVIKTTVFLSDMNDFAAMNAIYGEYLGSNPPARSTVEVARLPKDVLVEIECIVSL